MKLIFTSSLLLLFNVFLFGQKTEKIITYFDYGKFELTKQTKVELDNLIRKSGIKEVILIKIEGHTDSDGSNSFNKILSQDRVRIVQEYLVSKGALEDKISSQYFGEIQPITNNDNEEEKQRNRRVEIIIKYREKNIEIKKTKLTQNKLQKSINNSPDNVQLYKFPPQNEIIINGKKGTVIRIPKNSFVDKNGNELTSEVSIEIIEVYTKSDMVLNNIQTTSNEKLLESKGMIFISVKSQNIEVRLNKDKYYTIEFPTTNKQNKYNLFYGDTTSHNLNWEQAENNIISDYTYIENKKELNKYIFNSTELGWINCDRFINQTKTTRIIVNANDTLDVNFCLVFKSINSVMNVSNKNGGIQFNNVPIGYTATLIAFKKTKQEVFYSSKEITIKKNQSVPIIMERLTENEFKEKLKQLE